MLYRYWFIGLALAAGVAFWGHRIALSTTPAAELQRAANADIINTPSMQITGLRSRLISDKNMYDTTISWSQILSLPTIDNTHIYSLATVRIDSKDSTLDIKKGIVSDTKRFTTLYDVNYRGVGLTASIDLLHIDSHTRAGKATGSVRLETDSTISTSESMAYDAITKKISLIGDIRQTLKVP